MREMCLFSEVRGEGRWKENNYAAFFYFFQLGLKRKLECWRFAGGLLSNYLFIFNNCV